MTDKNFDYEEFAKDMVKQAKAVAPNDISKEAREYLLSTLENYTKMAGEALCNDDSLNLDVNNITFITQIVTEWTFHKCVDLAHSDIPMQYWDGILQKIAFTVYEVARQGFQRKVHEEQLLHAIEHHVDKVWKASIKDLLKKHVLAEEDANFAKELSHIDDMAKEVQKNQGTSEFNENTVEGDFDEEEVEDEDEAVEDNDLVVDAESDGPSKNNDDNKENEIDKNTEINDTDVHIGIIDGSFNTMKVVGKAAISVTQAFLKIGLIVCIIWGVIKVYGYLHEPSTAPVFIQNHSGLLMAIFWIYIIAIVIKTFSIFVNVDVQNQLKQLEKVRQDMQDLVNPDKMYERLGVDMICIIVGSGLLEIADPEQEGPLLAKLAALRQRLTDTLGYIIPNVRIVDSSELEPNEYNFSIRNNVVASGFVYPEMYMVLAEEWDSVNNAIPEDATVGTNPIYNNLSSGIHILHNAQVYWVKEEDITYELKTVMTPVDIMIKHLEEILIKHVESVLTIQDVQKYVETVRSSNATLVELLVPNLISLSDLRTIFVNLIREKISIKDIVFIFERLCDYARSVKEPDQLSERLRSALDRQICLSYTDKSNTLCTIAISKKWEKLLEEMCNRNEFGLQSQKLQEFLELTTIALMRAYKIFNVKYVIMAPPKIRLPLYNFLIRHIPEVVVMSPSELIADIYVEIVETIGEDTEITGENIGADENEE